MILVTGATGKVGGEVARQLAACGLSFRALVHDPSKSKGVDGPNVDVRYADYDNPESLDEAMEKVDHLFLLTPAAPRQLIWERNLADSASRMGVTHIVKLSVFGASSFSDAPTVRRHWISEKYIEATGIPFTHVRSNNFMQNLLGSAESISRDGKFYNAVGDGRISMIDVRDTAAVAVRALTDVGHVGRIYELTGPDSLTFSDVAERLSAIVCRDVQYVNLAPSEYRDSMLRKGMSQEFVDGYMALTAAYARGAASLVTNWVERVTGAPPIDIDTFIRDHLFAFAAEERRAA